MYLSNLSSLLFYIPELIILAGILIAILFESVPHLRIFVYPSVIVSLILSSLCLFFIDTTNQPLFMGMIIHDSFALYFKVIMIFTTLSIVLVSKEDNSIKGDVKGEYYALILMILLGLFSMVSARNLLMIYLSIELVSIPSYIIAGISKNNRESNEASLKYVIYGSFASGIMLFGLSWIYGMTGGLDLEHVSNGLLTFNGSSSIYLALLFIIVGFGYKISMVPFHYWTPDVYQGSPIPVAAFLSVAPKAAGFAIMIRIFYALFTEGSPLMNNNSPIHDIDWPKLIAILSALTMTVGNVLALKQTNVKRLLAYSSISHVGFMLIAFSIIRTEAIVSIMLYLFIYLFMNLAAFYMAIYMSNAYNAHTINEWNGIGKQSPVLGIFMVITLASLAGLPPTSGFIGKVYVFRNLFIDNNFIWLGLIAIINSVISLYYYFSIVKAMYFEENDNMEYKECPPILYWTIIIFSAQNILFYLYWSDILSLINKVLNRTWLL